MFNMEKVRVGISLQTYNAAGNLTGGWIDPTSTSGGLPRNG
jgi:hypothetical protein